MNSNNEKNENTFETVLKDGLKTNLGSSEQKSEEINKNPSEVTKP
jgi:hypothetical protein